MKKFIRNYWPLLLTLPIYTYIAYKLNFIQDDAYISYRYVANFLNGHGLVYNIGERIEGFTNFGWVVYLILWGGLGLNYILASVITGYLCGAGIIVLTYLLALKVFEKNKFYATLATLLMAFNLSLAYWSPAGLETAAFGFFAMLSFYLFIKRSWWLVFSMLMAVWIRPDGVVIAGLILIIETIQNRKMPKFSLSCGAIAFVLSLPFVIFKYFYYGSIIPNPFYAKTGFNLTQFQNGLEYAGTFLSDYGFYGVGLLVPLLFYRRLSRISRAIWWMTMIFTAYIVFIGGDVLKVHRFFVPVFGTSAILVILSLQLLAEKVVSHSWRTLVAFATTLILIALTIYQPYAFVMRYNYFEKHFTDKMRVKARDMKEADTTDFSVALPTIGTFGYELIGHKIIDMVGLTDSTIAKHSDDPIPGMQTTWKEAKHNSVYILSSSPDYIIFSTDLKPSAPAERALLLYPQFLQGYRSVGWFYKTDPMQSEGTLIIAYKRMQEIKGPFVPTYPVQWVEYYKEGLDAYGRGDMKEAIRLLEKSLQASPRPYYPYAIYQMAYCNMQLNNHDRAIKLDEMVLQIDSTVYEAHKDLYLYARAVGDTTNANIHKKWLQKLVPWYWPRLEAMVEQGLAEQRAAGKLK